MTTISDILRQQAEAKRLGAQGQQFQQLGNEANTFSVGGQGAPAAVDWGNIIQRGVGNFMGAQKQKQASEAESKADEMNRLFMQESIGTDPQAQKLLQMAQAGIPGAGQALASHISPKKEAMGAFLQYIQSGMADEAGAMEMAGKYGISPETASQMARTAQGRIEEANQLKRDSSLEELMMRQLLGQKKGGTKFVGNTGYTEEELASLPVEQRQEAFSSAKARESAESKEMGKARAEARIQLGGMKQAIDRAKDIINFADKSTFYPGQGGAVGPKANAVLSMMGKGNPNNANLFQSIAQLVLDATGGSLGAGISNADVAFFKEAQTNLEAGNRDTAVAQLNNGLAKLIEKYERAAKLAGEDSVELDTTGVPTSPVDYSTSSKTIRKYDKNFPSFEQMMKELEQ